MHVVCPQFFFVYETDDCSSPTGIFTPANLQGMCETERLLVDYSTFEPDFCVLDNDKCVKPSFSVTSLFYGSSHNYTCETLKQNNISNTWTTIDIHLATNAGIVAYGFFVDKVNSPPPIACVQTLRNLSNVIFMNESCE